MGLRVNDGQVWGEATMGGGVFGVEEEENRKRRKVAADLGLLPLSFALPKWKKNLWYEP